MGGHSEVRGQEGEPPEVSQGSCVVPRLFHGLALRHHCEDRDPPSKEMATTGRRPASALTRRAMPRWPTTVGDARRWPGHRARGTESVTRSGDSMARLSRSKPVAGPLHQGGEGSVVDVGGPKAGGLESAWSVKRAPCRCERTTSSPMPVRAAKGGQLVHPSWTPPVAGVQGDRRTSASSTARPPTGTHRASGCISRGRHRARGEPLRVHRRRPRADRQGPFAAIPSQHGSPS